MINLLMGASLLALAKSIYYFLYIISEVKMEAWFFNHTDKHTVFNNFERFRTIEARASFAQQIIELATF